MAVKSILVAILVLFGAPVVAADKQPVIEVVFSDWMIKKLPDLNLVEKKHEANFRKFRIFSKRSMRASAFNRALLSEINFATETLVPNLDDFSIENITKALVERNLSNVPPEQLPAKIIVYVDRILVEMHPVRAVRSHNTRMKGRLVYQDAADNIIAEQALSKTVRIFGHENNRPSDETYNFVEAAGKISVTPAVVAFLERAMEKMHPTLDMPAAYFVKLR